jgi:phosphomannomutase
LKHSGLASRGLIVGYDTRFASEEFASAVAEGVTANGIKVYLSEKAAPTPVISFATMAHKAGGAVIITASHNPGAWNGFKVKTETGTSVPPEVTSEIEDNIRKLDRSDILRASLAQSIHQGTVERIDLSPLYFDQLHRLVDIPALKNKKIKIIIDPMHGAGTGYLKSLLDGGSLQLTEIEAERNPVFPGMERPEPIAHNLTNLSASVRRRHAVAGLATDGDADRFGAVSENGIFITTLQMYALLCLYLLEVRGERGTIVRTITTTAMLDRLGEIFNVPVRETPVGFKWVAPIMQKENAMIGGEESGGYGFRGHVLERDGILASLYFLDFLAKTDKTPTQLIEYLYSKVGPHHFDRLDVIFPEQERNNIVARLKNAVPKELGGIPISRIDTFDGFRFILSDTSWLLVRFSGTEPLLRIYSEAKSPERVQEMILIGKKIAGV